MPVERLERGPKDSKSLLSRKIGITDNRETFGLREFLGLQKLHNPKGETLKSRQKNTTREESTGSSESTARYLELGLEGRERDKKNVQMTEETSASAKKRLGTSVVKLGGIWKERRRLEEGPTGRKMWGRKASEVSRERNRGIKKKKRKKRFRERDVEKERSQ